MYWKIDVRFDEQSYQPIDNIFLTQQGLELSSQDLERFAGYMRGFFGQPLANLLDTGWTKLVEEPDNQNQMEGLHLHRYGKDEGDKWAKKP
jgi:hypothetical protein